jgi:hypothetical protein
MSAYVLDSDAINKMVSGMFRPDHMGSYAPRARLGCIGVNATDNASEIIRRRVGTELFEMNVAAVSQRYPNDTRDDLPGPVGPKVYEYRPIDNVSYIELFKIVESFMYQCSEGDTETRPLYQAVELYELQLAKSIIRNMPEYEKAPWT